MYEDRGRGTAGQSRARNSRSRSSSARTGSHTSRSGSVRSSGTVRSSGSARSSTHRSTARNSGSAYRSSSTYRKRRPSHGGRHSSGGSWWLVLIGLVAIVAVISIIAGVKRKQAAETTEAESIEETTEPPTELQKTVTVDGVDITGMSRDVARAELLKEYPWSMQVTHGEEVYEVANLVEQRLNTLLDEIYFGEPKESYTLDVTGLDEAVAAQAAAVAQLWDKAAKNGSISEFDNTAGTFVFAGEEVGQAVDQEKLIDDINAALKKKEFDAVIQASVQEVQPEISAGAAKEKYKTISTFSTKTTANKDRNTNVRLACNAINGYVLRPGEEFSFNDVVGKRTEEKGYKAAGAYSNGEVVQEIGGGVCQVSTTLYNTVLRAGLKTTMRRSHTYEPSYVTPGQDATVSFGGPDYKFVNNSDTAIGIRASYGDQVCTVAIYGIPILEEGVKYELKSTKIKDTDPPAPTYEEDLTLQPGVEKIKSNGTQGSYWETRLVITKDGEEISKDVDHNTTYKGHAPVILRNTSGVVMLPEETSAPEETVVPSEGAADGIVPTQGTAPQEPSESSAANGREPGPGQGTTAPTTTAPTTSPTTAAPTTAAAPSVEAPGSVIPDGGEVGPGGPGGGDMIAPNPLSGADAP